MANLSNIFYLNLSTYPFEFDLEEIAEAAPHIKNFNFTYGGGTSTYPLFLACYFGNIDYVRLFIDNGADVNAKDGYVIHELFHNFNIRETETTPDILHMLLQNGLSKRYAKDALNSLLGQAGAFSDDFLPIGMLTCIKVLFQNGTPITDYALTYIKIKPHYNKIRKLLVAQAQKEGIDVK